MAGDWLKMRIDLHEDPAVIGMAVHLGIDEYAIVGRLHRLWGWANRQSSDGHAPSVTAEWIDRLVTQPGFAAAMQQAGWLELNASGAVFPRFERHNGQSAKLRVLAASRQQVHRSKNASRSQCDERVTREEQEKINFPLTPSGEDAGFKALLTQYPAHRCNRGAALKRWRAIAPDAALQELIMQAARTQARSAEWQSDHGKHVPNLSKWLHNEGWKRTHDDAAPPVMQAVASSQAAPVPPTPAELAANKALAKRLADETRRSIAERRLRETSPAAANPGPLQIRRESAGELRLMCEGDFGLARPADYVGTEAHSEAGGHPQ